MKNILAFIFAMIVVASCSNEKKNSDSMKVISSSDSIPDMNSVAVNLPYAEGEELFQANCITCHTLRYIEMQPNFSEKAWTKIVDKMVKSFGAPISDSAAKVIVKYLVSVKGKKQ
jgi:cytochrome c5